MSPPHRTYHRLPSSKCSTVAVIATEHPRTSRWSIPLGEPKYARRPPAVDQHGRTDLRPRWEGPLNDCSRLSLDSEVRPRLAPAHRSHEAQGKGRSQSGHAAKGWLAYPRSRGGRHHPRRTPIRPISWILRRQRPGLPEQRPKRHPTCRHGCYPLPPPADHIGERTALRLLAYCAHFNIPRPCGEPTTHSTF